MSQELHYTSVARGLKPGSRGFGTVAATTDLSEAMADRLEALSAYQAVYPPGDPSAALNPVVFLHVRLRVGDDVRDVLSRIGPAGLDYSGRPNKYAHHVILDPDERPDGGPAWLLGRPGFVRDVWEGEPRLLAAGSPVPPGDRPPGIARAWHDRTGDAGWAGVLAESFLTDPRRPVFLVFRPGMELLPMFAEAIALLPSSRRWEVEFTTYFTTLPPGISCHWRGVLDGSAQAKAARRLPHALIVDLCRPTGRASGGGLVHLARTGERIDDPHADSSALGGGPREPVRMPELDAGSASRPDVPSRSRTTHGTADRDWLPDLAAQLAADVSLLGGERLRPRRRRIPMPVLIVAACLVPMLAAALLLSPGLRRRTDFESTSGAHVTADRARSLPKEAAPPTPVVAKPKAEPPTAPKAEPAREPEPVAKAPALPKAEPVGPAKPGPRPPAERMLLTFTPPEIPRSSLGTAAPRQGTIALTEDTEDRVELLNGPPFLLKPVPAVPHTWEVATRTGSGLGGGFALARLNHADARTWRFEWSRNARARSTVVEALKDAVLGLHGRDGRPIYVLLRGVTLNTDRPLAVWDGKRIVFDKPEPRIQAVEWGGDSEVLDGTRWKPRIRRWRVVLTRPRSDAPGDEPPRRVIEPEPPTDDKADPPLERDLVPGEIRLKLAIAPERPGSIEVRVDWDPEKIREGRDDRATRLADLEKDTPSDKAGKKRDPLEDRRARLAKLRAENGPAAEELQSVEKEIADLERIREVRMTEDLLTRSARVELSVVIGLDVDGLGILEIVRIGEFAGGP